MSDEELLAKAITLACNKHMNQKRDEGTPYIYHPLHVAEIVKQQGYPIAYQIVAILHDVLEDTDTSAEELSIFGEDIVKAVQLLTREKGADEEVYVKNILENDLARVVKNADKLNNLSDIVYTGIPGTTRSTRYAEHAKRYLEKAKKYYQGKFSLALDKTIESLEEQLKDPIVPEKKIYTYSLEDMKLYK